jgi:hypothetical protein
VTTTDEDYALSDGHGQFFSSGDGEETAATSAGSPVGAAG